MTSALIAIVISLLMGAAAYYVTGKSNSAIEVSKREFLIGSAISIVVLLIAGPFIERMILDGKTTFYEYYNGYQTAAIRQTIVCTRDGDCDDTYACDPYLVRHTYEDSKGHEHTYYTTEYHQCPYLKVEYTYTIDSTLGSYQIGGQYAINRSPWRSGEAVPASIPRDHPHSGSRRRRTSTRARTMA